MRVLDPRLITSDVSYVFFEGVMPLIASFGSDRSLRRRVAVALDRHHDVVHTSSWGAATRLVRDRPVAAIVLDADAMDAGSFRSALRGLRGNFPGLGVVAVARSAGDPVRLFELGRAGIPHLVLLSVDGLDRELPRALSRARVGGTVARVLATLSPHVDRRVLTTVAVALDDVHRGLGAEELAARVGLSRPFLSECLKASALPSTGHLLIWTRLLHAGAWLTEPGRTGESVARQLGYHDGSAFRRALRNYAGATPTGVAAQGGLRFVLARFLERCGFSEPHSRSRVSVA